MTAILLFALITAPHWVKVKDAYSVHMRYENKYGNVLGEYYEETSDTFIAQCYPGEPVAFTTQDAARNAVLECRVWE